MQKSSTDPDAVWGEADLGPWKQVYDEVHMGAPREYDSTMHAWQWRGRLVLPLLQQLVIITMRLRSVSNL